MRRFLSEENLEIHKRECDTLRARLSIYEKSLPEIKGKSIREIRKMRIPNDYKEDILPIMRSLMLHKVYFSSFSNQPSATREIKKYYPSKESFIFSLLEAAKNEDGGFLCLYKTAGAPRIIVTNEKDGSLTDEPSLCIDISEHAYFLDYLFNKDKYLKSALSYLNLDTLFSDYEKFSQ